jgi:hypothetical protein
MGSHQVVMAEYGQRDLFREPFGLSPFDPATVRGPAPAREGAGPRLFSSRLESRRGFRPGPSDQVRSPNLVTPVRHPDRHSPPRAPRAVADQRPRLARLGARREELVHCRGVPMGRQRPSPGRGRGPGRRRGRGKPGGRGRGLVRGRGILQDERLVRVHVLLMTDRRDGPIAQGRHAEKETVARKSGGNRVQRAGFPRISGGPRFAIKPPVPASLDPAGPTENRRNPVARGPKQPDFLATVSRKARFGLRPDSGCG